MYHRSHVCVIGVMYVCVIGLGVMKEEPCTYVS